MFSQKRFTSMIGVTLGVVLALCLLGLPSCKRAALFPVQDEVFTAVRENDVDALEQFLDSGTSVDEISKYGNSLVYVAIGPKGGTEVLAALIGRGADLSLGSKKGRSPLMNAAGWCEIEAIEMLLEAGANAAYVAPSGLDAAESVCKAPPELRRQALTLLFVGGS